MLKKRKKETAENSVKLSKKEKRLARKQNRLAKKQGGNKENTFTAKKFFAIAKGYLAVLLAGAINGLSVHIFVNPSKLVPGGFTGLASILNYFTGWNISLLYFALNIPLLIAAVFVIRGDFTIKTIVAVVACTLTLEFLPEKLVFDESPLIAVIFGGILVGTSMALATMNNGSNAGTEIVAKIIHKKKPEMNLATVIMIANMAILVLGSVLLIVVQQESILTPFYSIIYVIVGGRVMSMIMRGVDRPKKITIVTKNYREVSDRITSKFKRGTTIMDTYDEHGNIKEYKAVVFICQNRQILEVKHIIKKYGDVSFTTTKCVDDIFLRESFNRSYRYDKKSEKN